MAPGASAGEVVTDVSLWTAVPLSYQWLNILISSFPRGLIAVLRAGGEGTVQQVDPQAPPLLCFDWIFFHTRISPSSACFVCRESPGSSAESDGQDSAGRRQLPEASSLDFTKRKGFDKVTFAVFLLLELCVIHWDLLKRG